jgi:plastocyanin
MRKVIVLKRNHMLLAVAAALVVIAALGYFGREWVHSAAGVPAGEERVVHMVTGEFKTTTPDGKEIEAYRFSPGTVFVQKGERVKLSIYGVNGESHPFIIEGLGVKGEVKKGQETTVSFVANKEGIYRIICLTHPDMAHNGPMIGYIVVD